VNHHKIRPFNQSIPNGRNHAGYGNTPPIEFDESRSPWFLIIGSFVVALVIMAVVS
jgi:hypothetical protein